jgi:hypothetical protein
MRKENITKNIEKAFKAARQLRQKKGIYYERWKTGMELCQKKRNKN